MSHSISKKQLAEILARYEAMYANILDVINTHSPETAVKPVTAEDKLGLIANVLMQEITPF